MADEKFIQALAWSRQVSQEAEYFLQAHAGSYTDREKMGYRQGFEQGFMKAFNTFKLHGWIKD